MVAFLTALLTMPAATAAIAAVYATQYGMSPARRRLAVAVHFVSVSAIICTYAALCVVEYRSTGWEALGWIAFAIGSAVFWYSVRCHPTCLMPDERHGVVSEGPYRRIRHPIYSGGLLAALGLLAVSPSWQVLVVWLVLVGCMGVLLALEERELLVRLGAPYADYRRTTDLLIPGVL